MNTKAVQEQLKGLKAADLAAYNAGQKSNFITNYLRNELIKRAAMADINLEKEIEVEFNMTSASYAIASLALLSKDGMFPALFKTANIKLVDGTIKLAYTINGDSLSKEYREKLNTSLGIQLALV